MYVTGKVAKICKEKVRILKLEMSGSIYLPPEQSQTDIDKEIRTAAADDEHSDGRD